MTEEDGITWINANSQVSLKCPLHLVYNMLEDTVERAHEYDRNILKYKSLGRNNASKRMIKREMWLRKPKLILRHDISNSPPHVEIRTREIPIEKPPAPIGEEGEGEEPPPPPEGEEGAEGEPVEEEPQFETIEEDITCAYLHLNLHEMGTVITEMEPTTGRIVFEARETDVEMCDFEVDIKIGTTSSGPPDTEALQKWADSLSSGLKNLSEKMIYLSPNMLGNPTKCSVPLYRSILTKAKKFEFISEHLARSPSAQTLIRDGSACGSLARHIPPRPMSSMN